MSASHQICQSCDANPATIHITEIKDDKRSEMHICEACATAQGLGGGTPVPHMLASLVQAGRRTATAQDVRCPGCGITFEEFRAKGRLGCPQDYEVFAEALGPLLDKIHGARRHTGRLPRGRDEVDRDVADRLLRLRHDLREAVSAEAYEEAARLRDEIRDVEEDTQEPGGPGREGAGRGTV